MRKRALRVSDGEECNAQTRILPARPTAAMRNCSSVILYFWGVDIAASVFQSTFERLAYKRGPFCNGRRIEYYRIEQYYHS